MKRLGIFKPSTYSDDVIADELQEFIFDKTGLKVDPHLTDVRSPAFHIATYFNSSALDWHQDSRGAHGDLFLWCNNSPTEVRKIGSKNTEPKLEDCEVVWIRNELYEHRRPIKIGKNRWFARAIHLSPEDLFFIRHRRLPVTLGKGSKA